MKKHEIVGIENALIDILVKSSDEEIEKLGLKKGVMQLVESDEQKKLLASLENSDAEYELGGSTANALRGAAVLGAKTLYSSALGNDKWNDIFRKRLAELNIADRTVIKEGQTGSCAVLVTPDAERTMNTFLGACRLYSREDLPVSDIESCSIFFSTGYVWDMPNQIDAIEEAVRLAKASGALFALDIADPFVVSRNGERFKEMAASDLIDILFANADEAKMLTGKEGEHAAAELHKNIPLVAVKVGSKGSFVAHNGKIEKVGIFPTEPVDSTGAGDMYAGGFLFGLAKGCDPLTCAKIGSFLAADNISRIGVRLSSDIKEKIVKAVPEIKEIIV